MLIYHYIFHLFYLILKVKTKYDFQILFGDNFLFCLLFILAPKNAPYF